MRKEQDLRNKYKLKQNFKYDNRLKRNFKYEKIGLLSLAGPCASVFVVSRRSRFQSSLTDDVIQLMTSYFTQV